ncbi:MAG: hypothetical protein LUG99_08925 [Lachnospiraceae bacterium]|nr:hypothetical protein [Lachnospiraceae bacterium]
MFQFKNGRFYANVACRREPHTLSFAIPEGCWIENQPVIVSSHFIPLYSPDQEVYIDLWAEAEDEEDFREALEESTREDGNQCLEGPDAVAVNGLEGYSAIYEGGSELFYEVVLDVRKYGMVDKTEDTEISCARLVVHTGKDKDIRDVVASETVQAALHGIRVD